MKKKILCTLLAATMAASLMAGCGNDNKTPSNSGNDNNNESNGGQQEITDYGEGNITIWVADNVTEFTKTKAEEFLGSDPAYSGYTVTVEAVGEGDAAKNVLTDVEGAADIFGFAQDQIARLVSAGALQPVTGDYAAWVEAQNDAGAMGAAKVGDMAYAFPLTSDNGYFLYYDKSVVTDPTSLEKIVEDCEAAGKNFYMEVNSGWYQPAFFFATGCELTYDTDNDGNFTACNTDYASDKGLVALKEIIEMCSSKSFQNGSSIDNGTNIGAIIDGTWDSGVAKSTFGENYACAKLPSFEGSDGQKYQMSGFGGFKLLGIKPQTEAGKLQLCMKLAQYLSGTEVQVARYQEVGWGPSNLEAQADSAVAADEALSALAEQLLNTIPQGNYPDEYWQLATSLADDIIAGTINSSMSDDELMEVLKNFQDTCISYAK